MREVKIHLMTQDTSQTIAESVDERQAQLAASRSLAPAYPNDFKRTDDVASAGQVPLDTSVALAGRLVARRTAGKATFANLADASGEIQLYVNMVEPAVLAWINALHFGDIIGIKGQLFRTKKGELTVKLTAGQLLAKCLQPYTPKVAPTHDRELKRRYLALAMQPALRARFRARAKLIHKLRAFFDAEGYLEVETPMLHAVQGGAAAKPFATKHAALDREYFLRIAPELYLKRLIVGGYEKVYEINRSFRNEGMSDQHNPEFTMLEFYAAYQRYEDQMALTERLLHELARCQWRPDTTSATSGKYEWAGQIIDLTKKFTRLTLIDSLRKFNDWDANQVYDGAFLANQVRSFVGAKADEASRSLDVGVLQAILYEKTVEHRLIQPTFITEFPAAVSPLARRCDNNPALAERFELVIGGREIANGFSELNDPAIQAEVFQEQVQQSRRGDEQAMQYDEDYLTALRYGMPPTAGEGIGIDRLAMLLLGCEAIRDVILFPQQKPEQSTKD